MGAPPTTPPAAPGAPPHEMPGVAESAEMQLIGARAVRFETHRVPPPAFLYVTQDDGLYVNISNVQAGVSLAVTATMLLPDGRVQANSWTMTPPSTGAQTPYLYPLGEGFLLNVSVAPPPSLRYGATWVFVCVRRGGLASGTNLQTLIADYADAYGAPTWPGARIMHSVDEPGLLVTTSSQTGPLGASYVYTVPSYARILVRSVFGVFAASATVATRTPWLAFKDSTNDWIWEDIVEPTVAASATLGVCWGLKAGVNQTTPVQGQITRSLPETLLGPGWLIVLGAVNQAAGDNWQYVSMVMEQWFTF